VKNQPGFMKKQPWTSKTNLEPWKSKTNLNPWKSVITDMEPWKTNLQPSKLTRSWTGWLWVVTGDSQEEVLIFRDKQTLHHNIYISTTIIVITSQQSLALTTRVIATVTQGETWNIWPSIIKEARIILFHSWNFENCLSNCFFILFFRITKDRQSLTRIASLYETPSKHVK